MRLVRISLGFAIAALIALMLARPGTAATGGEAVPQPDSAVASPPAVAAPADTFFTIYLEKGEPIKAGYVGSWSMDTVRYRTPAGATGYLTANKIRSIQDANGRECLGDILRHRSSLGELRPGAPTSPHFYWRGRPLPECSSFLVTEVGLHYLVNPSASQGSVRSYLFTIDLGYMRNRGERSALGALFHFGSDGDRTGVGPGIRYRRWLSKASSADVTAGLDLIGSVNPGGELGAPAPWAEAGISLGDVLALSIRGERWTGTIAPLVSGDSLGSKSVTTWHLGLKAGSYLGGAATVAFVVLLIVVIAEFASWGFD